MEASPVAPRDGTILAITRSLRRRR